MPTDSLWPQRKRRRFAITVDGVRHEVIVEELDAEADPADRNAPPGTAPSAGPSPAPPASAKATSNEGGGLAEGWLTAPMPGTVTEVKVKAGDYVQAGQVVVILTAMKLENEITVPSSGTVAAVAVEPGDNVNIGQRLVRLESGGEGA